jgi:hypothetical protein
MKNQELLKLLELENSLVYFTTSLKSNEIVMEKLMRTKCIKMCEEDEDILEDAIIENRQAIEMGTIYRGILSGTMEAYASIISNNLNLVMKFLASATIVMTIPTIIGGLWGMNTAGLPFATHPYGFWIVTGIALLISFIAYLIFAGLGMIGLKALTAVLCFLISGAVLYFLFMTHELLRRRSIWMTLAAACIIICLLVSLIARFPSPVFTLPQA